MANTNDQEKISASNTCKHVEDYYVYTSSTDILKYDFLTETECQNIADRVFSIRDTWIRRQNFFYTLGAASYLDGTEYSGGIHISNNKIIETHFKDLLDKTADFFEAVYDPTKYAYPGFHIFGPETKTYQQELPYRVRGDRHRDRQHVRFFRDIPIPLPHGTFTVLIQQPAVGAGLSYWDFEDKEHYHCYDMGNMNVHSGNFFHQPSHKGEILDDDWRITFQGHWLVYEGKRYLFF